MNYLFFIKNLARFFHNLFHYLSIMAYLSDKKNKLVIYRTMDYISTNF